MSFQRLHTLQALWGLKGSPRRRRIRAFRIAREKYFRPRVRRARVARGKQGFNHQRIAFLVENPAREFPLKRLQSSERPVRIS